jgi:hypothetical protein
MGYNTEYKGTLYFTNELTAKQLAYLNTILDEDTRDHEDWPNIDNYWVSLALTEQFDGLEWNGQEKTYFMDEIINFVIEMMQKKYPEFGLTGKFECQGEEMDDRYIIKIDGGKAIVIETPPLGEKIQCPHCEQYFYSGNQDG